MICNLCKGKGRWLCTKHSTHGMKIGEEYVFCDRCNGTGQVSKENDDSCFIATAVLNKEHSVHLQHLRMFRDQVLNSSEVGKTFIMFYYRKSPPIAKWIETRPLPRFIIRNAFVLPLAFLSMIILKLKFFKNRNNKK